MITKNGLINDFKKCPSVWREGKYFLYSPENKIWIVQNPLNDCWFFEKEKPTGRGSIVSRVYFRSASLAKSWFLEGNEIIW
jgi:hypothetical protein